MAFVDKDDARWVVPIAEYGVGQEMSEVLDFDDQLLLMKDAGRISRKFDRLGKAVPAELYAIGALEALAMPLVAIVGQRKATPYGLACARRFAMRAVETGYAVVSGGGVGIAAAALRAAVEAGGLSVAVLAGGLDDPYPRLNHGLFRDMIDHMGTLVSEQPWESPATPYMFQRRNRIIAALADAVLVVEAGVPSGSFSLCDDAIAMGKPVLAVPGPITAFQSAGPNVLIAGGATPILDDASFLDAMQRASGGVVAAGCVY